MQTRNELERVLILGTFPLDVTPLCSGLLYLMPPNREQLVGNEVSAGHRKDTSRLGRHKGQCGHGTLLSKRSRAQGANTELGNRQELVVRPRRENRAQCRDPEVKGRTRSVPGAQAGTRHALHHS